MTLQQMFDTVNKKTYFSRDDDEIWGAISAAANLLYQEVVNENEGYFTQWDTTSVTLGAGQDDYALPADLEQIMRIRVRGSVTEPWQAMLPADLNSIEQSSTFTGPSESPSSTFTYFGPYLPAADPNGAGVLHIRVGPIPQDSYSVELVYTSKFTEITGPESSLVIPAEGHGVVTYGAVAELLATNDDDNADRFEHIADRNKLQFMKLVRNRQRQNGRTVEPYFREMD